MFIVQAMVTWFGNINLHNQIRSCCKLWKYLAHFEFAKNVQSLAICM